MDKTEIENCIYCCPTVGYRTPLYEFGPVVKGGVRIDKDNHLRMDAGPYYVYRKIWYCPICGRKLGGSNEENNSNT